jgi:hypothetical protein
MEHVSIRIFMYASPRCPLGNWNFRESEKKDVQGAKEALEDDAPPRN